MSLIGKTVKFEPEQIDKLNQFAKSEDRSFSWLVRKAVSEFIENKFDKK